MASHVDIFEFCLFYLICFTALFSLTPLGSFPPRDIVFTSPALGLAGINIVPEMIWDIPWTSFIIVMGVGGLGVIILISLLSNISFTLLGSGVSWKFDAKYVSTIIIGVIVAGGLGVSMQQMLPSDVPILIAFFLVWMWIILLVYSVILYAGSGSSGN